MYLLLSFSFSLFWCVILFGFLTILPYHIRMFISHCSSALCLLCFLNFLGGLVHLLFNSLSAVLYIFGSVDVFVLSFKSVVYMFYLASVSVIAFLYLGWFSNCLMMCHNMSIFCPSIAIPWGIAAIWLVSSSYVCYSWLSASCLVTQILYGHSVVWSPFSTIVQLVSSPPSSLWTIKVDPFGIEIIISEHIIVLVRLCISTNVFIVVIITDCIYWWSVEYQHNACYWAVK